MCLARQLKWFSLCMVLCVMGCTRVAQSPQTPRILHLYCWSNYFSPEVIKAFEEQARAKVELSYFSSNEELLAKLQAGARGYDLIVPSSYLVKALKNLKLIEPLGKVDWPELSKLVPRVKVVQDQYDPNHEYTVPYAWGTSGIAVNRAKIKANVDSWDWVFNHPELKGQVSMLDDAPAVVGIALKYLGYSYNESSPEALAKVKQLLVKQKRWLKAYTSESQPLLESGEVALAHAYSGDTLQVRRKNPNIEYVFPKEGSEIFIDTLAIPKGAPSPDLAKEFMRFTLQQKIAAIQVEHLFFSPVVDVSGFLQTPTLISNVTVFPTPAQVQHHEMMDDSPERIEAIEKLWVELKSM